MKKVLVGITAAVCAAVMCVGLVACGPNAKGVKSIKVTEDEWNAALEYLDQDDAEFSIELAGESFEKAGDKSVTGKTTGNGRVKGGKAYYKTELKYSGNGIGDGDEYIMTKEGAEEQEKRNSIEQYAAVEGGITYVYEKNDEGKWVKTVGASAIDMLFTSLGSFSNFEYNEEEKGYVAKSSSFGPTIVLKFGKVGDDVRLVAIYTHLEVSTTVATVSMESRVESSMVLHYGSVADINLPSVG